MNTTIRTLVFVCFATLLTFCDKENKKQEAKSNDISIGKIDSLYSSILGENRKIWVYSPGDTSKKYPLLVLLDGDAHFHSVTGLVQQLSTINGNTVCPEMVIVGIPNTDRTRDLTPTHVREMFGDTTFSKTSGGGENFTKFIQDELLPYVDNKYPTAPYRTLVGHSFGGLFVINTLVHHPEMFSNYLAIDPSMWWDNRKLTGEAEQALGKGGYGEKSLFVAVANTMNEGMTVESVRNDTSQNTFHIRSILNFNDVVKRKNSGLAFATNYYGEDDHSSVPLIATYEALRKFFSWYNMKSFNKYFDNGYKGTAADMIAHIKQHYETVSKHYGYHVLPAEGTVNGMGYNFLFSKMPEKAFACFQLNIENYPKSANVYDSMGDYYLNQKDTVQAVDYFQKSLALEKRAMTQEKYDKYKKEIK